MALKDIINPAAAGIDIGSDKYYVCVSEGTYKVFTTYHEDCEAIAAYLLENNIQTVAFESTGVYWMHLYDVLRSKGLDVCLVNPVQTKRRTGDTKSDVSDCQWIRHLHVRGMLRGSFIPEPTVQAMRSLLRMRDGLVESRAQQENLLIKTLTLMNVRLKETISSVTSVSGQAIIRAIIAGESDPHRLLALAHKSIARKKGPEMLKALRGDYAPEKIFMLSQAFQCWLFLGERIAEYDRQLASMMDSHIRDAGTSLLEVDSRSKDSRTNNAPRIDGLHEKVVRMAGGVDLAKITCISDYTAMKLLMEIGTDLSKFPSCKHFCAWLGLAPKKHHSGKTKRSAFSPTSNAGQIIRQASASILLSRHNALGEFGRRIASRRGSKVAIKAVARKVAVAVYNALSHGEEYVEQGAQKYSQALKEKELRLLNRLAEKLGYSVTPEVA